MTQLKLKEGETEEQALEQVKFLTRSERDEPSFPDRDDLRVSYTYEEIKPILHILV